MRVCKCGVQETEESPFYKKTSLCPVCYCAKKKENNQKYRSKPGIKEHYNRRASDRRKDPNRRSFYIVEDSKKYDRIHGLENNLTIELVEELISKCCAYCGEDKLKMTLDRIDNSIGHVIDNLIPCCVRCNYVRRDMPHQAWMTIADSMRKARELGLFGNWSCEVYKRKNGEAIQRLAMESGC